MKVLPTLDPSRLGSLRREVHALRQLDHPGIVRVLADGFRLGEPWYAMERLAESSLGSVASGHTPQWREVIQLYRLLCEPLAYLHGEGFVHRDLSPGNVVLRDQGIPVLTDLGLAAQLRGDGGRDVLASGGELLGTLPYMAPEQIYGELVDARADLYSFGCMLYESLTGTPPFSGSPGEVLNAHLEADARPVREYVPDLPDELNDLVLALLEKRPEARLGYASDVAAILEDLGAECKETVPCAQPYVYRPNFHGREDVIRSLSDHLDALLSGRGSRLVIEGESGIGKTRLATEFATLATTRACRVILGDSVPVPEPSAGTVSIRDLPLHSLRSLLQTASDHFLAEEGALDKDLLRHARLLESFEPSFSAIPGLDELPEPTRIAGPDFRRRLFLSLEALLVELSRSQPLVVLLDDIQWADELSLEFVSSLSQSFFKDRPVLILGTCRDEESNEAIRGLAQNSTALSLRRLHPDEVSKMIGGMLALSDPPSNLVEQLVGTAEGIPFFASELLRSAVEDGLVTRASGGWEFGPFVRSAQGLPLPRTLEQLVTRRLDQVVPAVEHYLSAAACLGREFTGELLAMMVSEDSTQAVAASVELVRRNILEETSEGQLRFVHDKILEAAYQRIETSTRPSLHATAARSIEARTRDQTDPRRDYPDLAYHWGVAGENDKASDYSGRAGAVSLEGAAYREAIQFFGRALDLADPIHLARERKARWLRQRAEAHWGLGELQVAEAGFVQALQCLGVSVPTTGSGWAWTLLRESTTQAINLLGGVRGGRIESEEAAREAALSLARLSLRFFFLGESLSTVGTTLAAVNKAETVSSEVSIAPLYWQLGYIASILHARPLAERYYARAHQVSDRTKDLAAKGSTIYAEATHQLLLANWDEAIALGQQSVDIHTQAADPQGLGMALTVFGHALHNVGAFERSGAVASRLLKVAEEFGNNQHLAWGYYTVARSELAQGNLSSARGKLEQSNTILADLSDAPSNLLSHGLLALTLARQGSIRAASEMAHEALMAARLTPPVVFTIGHGHAALCEALVLIREAEKQGDAEENPRTKAAMREALGRFLLFAVPFSIERPALSWIAAHAFFVEGRRSLARRLAIRASHSAQRLALPYPKARASWILARLHPETSPERLRHGGEARTVFERLGCNWEIDSMNAAEP